MVAARTAATKALASRLLGVAGRGAGNSGGLAPISSPVAVFVPVSAHTTINCSLTKVSSCTDSSVVLTCSGTGRALLIMS